jgi:signal transduction histidine kinase
MTNAADALEGTPQPVIGLHIRQIAKHTGQMVLIEVEDNGRGITEKDFKNLFKPFYTTKPKGTGLGLAIVKKMMIKMNGDVEISSREGRGTTVRLSLPAGA